MLSNICGNTRSCVGKHHDKWYRSGVATYHLTVGDRGRIVLPAALRAECGIAAGVELIATVDADGGIAIASGDALLAKLERARALVAGRDGSDDLREWRGRTEAEREERLERPAASPADAAARGRELLDLLGL